MIKDTFRYWRFRYWKRLYFIKQSENFLKTLYDVIDTVFEMVYY